MPTTSCSRHTVPFLRRHRHFGALGIFVLVIGTIYASVLDGTRSLITNGPWTQPLFVLDPLAGGPATAPLTRLAVASWLHLHLPIVDPFQGFGIPLLANQGVPLYLPQLLFHLAFPSNYSIWNVVNLITLAFGVYLLAASFGQRFPGAVSAGLLAALAGAAPPNVNMSMLNPLAVFPFLLLAVRYAVDPACRNRLPALLGIATAVALSCLSGFQEVLPLMAVVTVVYMAAEIIHLRTWARDRWLIVWSAAAALAGAAIGSVGILPVVAVLRGGTSLNGSGDYLPHAPLYWLSTLTLPSITDRALNQAPQDLGNTVFTVGTPLLVLVVVLALAVAIRRDGRRTRWYVVPSAAFVVYGVLGYADVGHVLALFDIPLFDAVQTRRFLQFAWWIPLCLLLGAVVSNPRVLRWRDALLALAAAAGFDAYFLLRYRQAAIARHLAGDTANILHAPVVAGVVVVAFLGAAMASRRFGAAAAGVAMALVVLASCVYDLPTNFAPAAYDSAVRTVHIPGVARTGTTSGNELVYFGIRQLPTEQHSFQVYGPIIPTAYRDALTSLFSLPEAGGLDPVAASLPTLAELAVTPRAVSVLRSFGVNLLVVPRALSGAGFGSVPPCDAPAGTARSPLVCFLGKAAEAHPGVGYAPTEDYAYRVLGADALVQREPRLTPVASTLAALHDFTRQLSSSSTTVGSRAYVTSTATHLRAARGAEGLSSTSTAQEVSISLRTRAAGIVVLRETYEAGARVTVDGRAATASPVDGGLWTAVHVGPGVSRVVLDYATTADLVEFGLAGAGSAALAVAWAVLGLTELRRRAGRRRRARESAVSRRRPSPSGAARRPPGPALPSRPT